MWVYVSVLCVYRVLLDIGIGLQPSIVSLTQLDEALRWAKENAAAMRFACIEAWR